MSLKPNAATAPEHLLSPGKDHMVPPKTPGVPHEGIQPQRSIETSTDDRLVQSRHADVDEGEHAGRGKLKEKGVRQQPEEREDGRSEGAEEAGERAGPREGDLREHHKGDAASEPLILFSRLQRLFLVGARGPCGVRLGHHLLSDPRHVCRGRDRARKF